MNVRTAPRMDKDAFFAWIGTQERRFELVDGVPVMQPYTTRDHARICSNILGLLLRGLDTRSVDVMGGDFAVETGQHSIRYADVMVCPRAPGPARSTEAAILLVEVLSPSTSRVDLGPKLVEYRGLASLHAYLVCSQDQPRVTLWVRAVDGSWPEKPAIIEALSASVAVPGLGLELPMAQIYDTVFG